MNALSIDATPEPGTLLAVYDLGPCLVYSAPARWDPGPDHPGSLTTEMLWPGRLGVVVGTTSDGSAALLLAGTGEAWWVRPQTVACFNEVAARAARPVNLSGDKR